MWWGTPKCVYVNAPIHFALVQHWPWVPEVFSLVHKFMPWAPPSLRNTSGTQGRVTGEKYSSLAFLCLVGSEFSQPSFHYIHVYQQLHVNKCHVMSISYHRYMNCRMSFMTWQPQSREEHAISRREGLDAFGDTAGECLWQRLSNAWPYRRSPAEDSYSLAWGNKTLILLCWP